MDGAVGEARWLGAPWWPLQPTDTVIEALGGPVDLLWLRSPKVEPETGIRGHVRKALRSKEVRTQDRARSKAKQGYAFIWSQTSAWSSQSSRAGIVPQRWSHLEAGEPTHPTPCAMVYVKNVEEFKIIRVVRLVHSVWPIHLQQM